MGRRGRRAERSAGRRGGDAARAAATRRSPRPQRRPGRLRSGGSPWARPRRRPVRLGAGEPWRLVDGAGRPRAGRRRRDRHRLAARLARGELRAAHAGRAGALLPRARRARSATLADARARAPARRRRRPRETWRDLAGSRRSCWCSARTSPTRRPSSTSTCAPGCGCGRPPRRSGSRSRAGTTPRIGPAQGGGAQRALDRRTRTRPSSTPSPRGAVHAAPDTLARVALALAHARRPVRRRPRSSTTSSRGRWPTTIAARRAHGSAKRPVVVTGTAHGQRGACCAPPRSSPGAARRRRPRGAPLFIAQPEANTMGLALLGGGRLGGGAARAAQAAESARRRRARERPRTGARRRGRGRGLPRARAARRRARPRAQRAPPRRADVVLPAATWAESTGTFVSTEGRAQRFFAGRSSPAEGVRAELALAARPAARARAAEATARGTALRRRARRPGGRAAGSSPASRDAAPPPRLPACAGEKVARKPRRYSGRTAMTAHLTVHEPKPPEDPDTPLAFSQEGYRAAEAPGALVPRFWAPGWNSSNSLHKFQEEVERAAARRRRRACGSSSPAPAPPAPATAGLRRRPPFAPREGEWLRRAAAAHLRLGDELSVSRAGRRRARARAVRGAGRSRRRRGSARRRRRRRVPRRRAAAVR